MTEYKSLKEVREWKRKAVANRTVKEYGKYLNYIIHKNMNNARIAPIRFLPPEAGCSSGNYRD